MSVQAPIEAKVKTSTVASAASALVLAGVSQYLFHGGEVPDFLEVSIVSAMTGVVTGAITAVVGYCTKHTPRVIHIEQDPPVVNRGDW